MSVGVASGRLEAVGHGRMGRVETWVFYQQTMDMIVDPDIINMCTSY